MANTFELISSTTVGSTPVASVSFSSIPSTYTDLVLKASARFSGSQNWLLISFNGSTSNFSVRGVYGTGSSPGSFTGSQNSLLGNDSTYTANTFSNGDLYIPNYAGSTYKSYSIDTVQENNASSPVYGFLNGGLWSDTSAITSITLTPEGSGVNIVQHSSFYLYGVKNA
jgi:hypothetical protein